jgi:hypothetical protein
MPWSPESLSSADLEERPRRGWFGSRFCRSELNVQAIGEPIPTVSTKRSPFFQLFFSGLRKLNIFGTSDVAINRLLPVYLDDVVTL